MNHCPAQLKEWAVMGYRVIQRRSAMKLGKLRGEKMGRILILGRLPLVGYGLDA
jgi:hypothetical protein